MKRPQLVSQGSLNRILQAADEAWKRRDFQLCLETLERASGLAPANVDILLKLGRIHGLRYDYNSAERCFAQAVRMAPRKTEILTAVANRCRNFRNPETQERYLQRALEQPDATPEVCVQLAALYESLRRVPEATQLVERALKLNPDLPAALVVRARLERQAGRLEAAEQVLRSFVTDPLPTPWIHAQAWYELGYVLDSQMKFDDAMEAFLEAKRVMRSQASDQLAELEAVHARLKGIEATISLEMCRRWFDSGSVLAPSRRLVLLAGYARSGTTLLEQVLDSHPDIVSAGETDIFVDHAVAPLKWNSSPNANLLTVLEAANIPSLQQAREAYFRAMDLCLGSPVANRLLLDKNPMLTCMIPAFMRIFPEARFIIALRDPRDVVISRFMQGLRPISVNAAFSTLEGTIEDYVVIMGLWRKLAPLMPVPWLEVRYEDMVADLETVAHKSLEFLGVPGNAKVLGFDEHARQKVVRSQAYADVSQPIYKRAVGRWRNYQKYLEPHLETLEPFVKAFGYQ